MPIITQKAMDIVSAEGRELMMWCDRPPSFGLRVYPSGNKVFVAQWKTDGRTRKLGLGKHPFMKADAARRRAVEVLAAVSRGEDPAAERDHAKASPTVGELCTTWLALGTGPTGKAKRSSTLAMDRSRIEAHVVPVLGTLKVRSVTPARIRTLVAKIEAGATAVDQRIEGRPRARRIVKGGPGVAHRTLRMVRAIMAHAVKVGLIASNPARHVQGGADGERERFLAPAELGRLRAALAAAEAVGTSWQAVAAISLILASGLRRNEALALRWSEVDFDHRRLVLVFTKTGRSVRPLSRAAIAILAGIKDRAANGWVFPATSGEGHYVGLQRVWAKVRADALLDDVHLHDLRHTFAAGAAMSGASLLTVGRMLGHAKARSSERYSHLSDDFLSDAADKAADVINLDTGRKSSGTA